MACSFSSLQSEKGIKELNDHLEARSYLGGGSEATPEDFDWFSKIACSPDKMLFPHAWRWFHHVGALKVKYPHRNWARAAAAASSRGGPAAASAPGAGGGRGKDQARLEGLLPNAVEGQVCTRFPPEPSGYLHIGHAKAAMLNNHYARHYKGKLILRFDDTNPSKEKVEFVDSIIKDLATLKVFPDVVSYTSDHFPKLQEVMEKLLKQDKAYVDDTDVAQMREERDAGTHSKRRTQPQKENLRLWGEMLKGSAEGLRCCVRAKMDMESKNKCLRDPVFYRCKTDIPHHRHGTKYKAYPTYDFACPVVDSLEGVSHALRTIEYKDRDDMYKWVQEATGIRTVELVEFSKTQFTNTILSKRKLAVFVEKGMVEGWSDPRFPTVQGVLRRGMTVEGLQEFVMTQGMSKSTNLMEWDKIWAINKQIIDPIVPRYSAVNRGDAVLLRLDGPAVPTGKMDKKHPKNPEMGERLIMLCKDIWVDQEDAAEIKDGEEVTLLHWGNAYVDKRVVDKSTGKVVEMVGRLHTEGNVKDTKKKIHWVPNLESQVTQAKIREFDHLVTKPKIEDDDVLDDIINPCSMVETEIIGDPSLKTLQQGDKIQLERMGFYIVDKNAFPPGSPMVLVKIPDGKAKDMGIASKVDPAKLQGRGAAVKKEGKGEKKEAAEKQQQTPQEAAKAEAPKADGGAKADGKAKAKAKAAAGKKEDRPLDDISRLNIKIGRIEKVWPHPESEKLYCEEINLGEGQNRTIASGLRAHLKEEDMKDKLVVVLANLKPRKMQGFESQGMVMCTTSSTGQVELLQVPEGAQVGERVMVEGVEMLPADEKLNDKTGKAPWEALKDGCRTTANKVAAYKGAVWQTSAGPVTSKTVADGPIA